MLSKEWLKVWFIVGFLKTDPKARYQGYTFFFREGFCWNNVLNPNARLLKTKMKSASVNDVGSMSLYSLNAITPNCYFVCLLNSNLLFDYYRDFINCTVNIQINDIRQLPVVIPTPPQLKAFESLFCKAYLTKKKQFQNKITSAEAEKELSDIQQKLDKMVYELYAI